MCVVESGVLVAQSMTTFLQAYAWAWFIGSLLFCAMAARLASRRWEKPLDKWLSESASRRRRFSVFTSVAFAIVVPWFIDRSAMLSAIRGSGTWDAGDTVSIMLAAALFVGFLWCQGMVSLHADNWNERLAEAGSRAAAEEGLRKKIAHDLQYVLTVTNTFLGIVGHKADRVRELVPSCQDGAVDLEKLRDALNPAEQILKIVMAVYDIYRDQLTNGQSLRVAYFYVDLGHLKVRHCWNGVSRNCITSPNSDNRKRFKMATCATKCLAVAAAHSGKIEIVANAEEADRDQDSPFRYFESDQRPRIKSIVAIPLKRDGEAAPFEIFLCWIPTSRVFLRIRKTIEGN